MKLGSLSFINFGVGEIGLMTTLALSIEYINVSLTSVG